MAEFYQYGLPGKTWQQLLQSLNKALVHCCTSAACIDRTRGLLDTHPQGRGLLGAQLRTQMINHGVNPVGAVAQCSQCHGNGEVDMTSDSMLDSMGYSLKGPKEQVCNQCHDGSKRPPRTWDRMHSHVSKGSTASAATSATTSTDRSAACATPATSSAPASTWTRWLTRISVPDALAPVRAV